MKKFLVALSLAAFAFVGCDDSSSASAGPNDEPAVESSSAAEHSSSSSSAQKNSSSSEKARSQSSSSEKSGKSSSSANDVSSSSEKLSETSSSSADKMESSSNSEFLATPCKTETEDNCEYGTVLDDRDGQTYKTVKIGDQWWMAENLNYETDNSFCYNDSAEYCEKYGRLYTWAAAIDSVKLANDADNPLDCGYGRECGLTGKVQGICPSGWHLPSYDEWNALFTAVGGQLNAGKVLKSQTGWYSNGNGTDAFGFSALPAGDRYYSGGFDYDGYHAYFWSATEDNSGYAYSMFLYYYSKLAYLGDGSKNYGFSVRCLKD